MSNTEKFPGTIRSEDGESVVWTNEVTGIAMTEKGDGTFTMLHDAIRAHDPVDASFPDLGEAQSAYAVRWLQWAAAESGLAFHPDTPADGYIHRDDSGAVVDGFSPHLAGLDDQYDAMIVFAHEHLVDLYATALDATEKAFPQETVDASAPSGP